jgi:hypothetical protein
VINTKAQKTIAVIEMESSILIQRSAENQAGVFASFLKW